MDAEHLTELLDRAKKALRSKIPYQWTFVMKAADGEPWLFLAKKASETLSIGRAARTEAKDKKGGRGRVKFDGRTLVFGLEEGNATPRMVQKALREDVADVKALAALKTMLKRARVVELEVFDGLFGPPAEEKHDLSSLQEALEDARRESKTAYDAAIARAGADHPEVVRLAKLAEEGKAARKAALEATGEAAIKLLEKAIDLYQEIADTAEAAGAGIPDVGEDEGSEPEEVHEHDPARLAQIFRDAMDDVGKQLESLRVALLATNDEELQKIAETGLGSLTAGHRTRMQSALMEARSTSGEAQTSAVKKVALAAEAFLDHLEDERFDAVDDNPFGVKMQVRRVLGHALRELSQA